MLINTPLNKIELQTMNSNQFKVKLDDCRWWKI